jgi:hypothetical protein
MLGQSSTPGSAGVIHRIALGASALAICMLVSACGGSSHTSSSSTSKSTTTAKRTTTTAKKPLAPVLAAVTEGILSLGSKTTVSSISAKTGDALTFRTQLPGRPKQKVKVQLTFALGPASTLTVTAKVHGRTAAAIVKSANGKRLTLQQLHYECLFPPLRTICPLHNLSTGSSQDRIQLTSAGGSFLSFGAKVGPVPVPARKVTISGTVVPAYKLSETVRVIPPKTGNTAPTPSAPASSASVKSGSTVAFTTVAGGLAGAAQKLTLTIEQGPAKSIAVTASVLGGKISQATVRSAGSSPIELVLPRYICFFPPAPTFCPAMQVQAGVHRYSVTFPVTPSSQPVTVQATVQ